MDGPRPEPGAERRADGPEALALEAQAGSVRAFEELVARFEAPLFRFLHVRTRDAAAAEDLTQEAFLRAWQKLAHYDPRWRFSTWLYTLAERLCISARRARSNEPVLGVELPPVAAADGVDPAREVAERDEGRALWETATRILRPEERSALWLRYAEDLSMDEIGAILGRPAVTVRVLLFRARGRLFDALEDQRATRPAGPFNRPALAEEGLGGTP